MPTLLINAPVIPTRYAEKLHIFVAYTVLCAKVVVCGSIAMNYIMS